MATRKSPRKVWRFAKLRSCQLHSVTINLESNIGISPKFSITDCSVILSLIKHCVRTELYKASGNRDKTGK